MEQNYCAIYLSGTGNTKFCVSKLVKLLDENAPVVAIEDDALSALKVQCPQNGAGVHCPKRFPMEGETGLYSCDDGGIQRRRRGLLGKTFEKVRRDRLGRSSPKNAGQRLRQ